ncbi:MAG: S4 domain-containing protein, partial [Pseudomonadota bacterium]
MAKVRADQLLVERGLADSRNKAQALILGGSVFSGERRIDKPGQLVAGDVPLELRGRSLPYVSRGGLKLAHGLDDLDLDPSGMTA